MAKPSPMSTQPMEKFLRTLKYNPAAREESRGLMELTLAQLQRLADEFDLGRVIQMDKPLTTQCNTTDPFKTGRGTFMLRARHGEEFGARVEYLHKLINYLCSHGFPAAQVMRSHSGTTWTTWGERIVEIHRFVPHDPGVHRDWRRMNAAATALGDLHRMFADAVTGITPVPPEMRNDVSPEQCLNLLYEAEETIAHLSATVDARARAAIAVCQRAREVLEPIIPDHSRMIGNLPWMTIHGDYHFWNVLYRADQIAAVVDYDFVQERERIFDIAYAMQNVVSHLRSVHGAPLRGWGNLAWGNVRIWVDHYDEVTHLPLTAVERRWLPREILRIFLVGIATSVLQEDPVELILRHGEDLELFIWISEQEKLFA
jgi:homoserine kinase type II